MRAYVCTRALVCTVRYTHIFTEREREIEREGRSVKKIKLS